MSSKHLLLKMTMTFYHCHKVFTNYLHHLLKLNLIDSIFRHTCLYFLWNNRKYTQIAIHKIIIITESERQTITINAYGWLLVTRKSFPLNRSSEMWTHVSSMTILVLIYCAMLIYCVYVFLTYSFYFPCLHVVHIQCIYTLYTSYFRFGFCIYLGGIISIDQKIAPTKIEFLANEKQTFLLICSANENEWTGFRKYFSPNPDVSGTFGKEFKEKCQLVLIFGKLSDIQLGYFLS